jgi:predicted PurR-regulated permease PerM
MNVYIEQVVKKTLKPMAVLAVAMAIVLAVAVIALHVHFVSELLAAELLFVLLLVALFVIASSLYVVGMAAESIERYIAATLHGLSDFYRRLHPFANDAAMGQPGLIPIAITNRLRFGGPLLRMRHRHPKL